MIVAIVGPTGVGKTRLSVKLAKKMGNCEIINCDSMQIYREMNIGVAKIREEEKEGIIHHLFDVVSVLDDFSVYDYQVMGRKIINDLLKSDKNVIIVGGTGLYLKALLYDYTFDGDVKSNHKVYDFTLVGLTRDRKILYDTINERVDMMFEEGLLEEVCALYEKGIFSRAVKSAIGYKELYEYFDGNVSLEDAILKIKQSSRRYAKRQYTFFNHQFDDIIWYDIDKVSFDDIINDVL